MTTARVKRLAALAGAIALATTACSSPATPTSGSDVTGEFDWKRFDQETLSVYIADTGQAELLQQKLPEFEELTGIDVTIETAAGGAAIVPAVVSGDYEFGFSNTLSGMPTLPMSCSGLVKYINCT